MNVKTRVPLQWACAVIGTKNYKNLRQQYEKRAVVRFTVISAALISQIVGLLAVTFLGILIGSSILGLLR